MPKIWKNALVRQSQTVREAIQIIDRAGLRAAFVIDEDWRLLGMVTDGDIRRGLLREVAMDQPVALVMNAHPLTCPLERATPEHVRVLLEQKQLLHMPVVDQGRLVDVIVADALAGKPRYENPVFLMAGGFGTRLRPLTNDCPKPMLKVGEKPILQIIMESFIEAGFYRFYMSTHYLPEVIHNHFGDGSAWGVQIEYVHEAEPLGTGGALGLLPDSVGDEPLIMMNGDLLTRINFEQLLKFHQEHDAVATLCLREFEMQVPYGVLDIQDSCLVGMREKPTYRFNVNAGIYVVEASVRRQVQKGERLDMPTLLERQLAHGRTVAAFPIHEYWLDIGRVHDFERAQQDVTRYFT